jgi:hypothetical protein
MVKWTLLSLDLRHEDRHFDPDFFDKWGPTL